MANLPDVLVRYRDVPRARLHDGDYDLLGRGVIERNETHVLKPESTDARLRQLIAQWPDFCLMLRGAEMPDVRLQHARLPEFISAFRGRIAELSDDPAANREIALDAKFVFCLNAWEAERRGGTSVVALTRESLKYAPLFASTFLVRQLAGSVVRGLGRRGR